MRLTYKKLFDILSAGLKFISVFIAGIFYILAAILGVVIELMSIGLMIACLAVVPMLAALIAHLKLNIVFSVIIFCIIFFFEIKEVISSFDCYFVHIRAFMESNIPFIPYYFMRYIIDGIVNDEKMDYSRMTAYVKSKIHSHNDGPTVNNPDVEKVHDAYYKLKESFYAIGIKTCPNSIEEVKHGYHEFVKNNHADNNSESDNAVFTSGITAYKKIKSELNIK